MSFERDNAMKTWAGIMTMVIACAAGVTTVNASSSGMQSGLHCEVSVPPPSSGIDGYRKQQMRIYPRWSDMGPHYSGCQTVFVEDEGRWQIVYIGRFVNGEVVEVKIPAKPSDPLNQCLRENGRLIRGTADECYMGMFPARSAPARCLTNPDDSCEFDWPPEPQFK